MNALVPLETLYDMEHGNNLSLPPDLAALYGRLQFPLHPGRPYVIGNFVSTLDGVVTLNIPGQAGGGPISGFNPHDHLVMGLLRTTQGEERIHAQRVPPAVQIAGVQSAASLSAQAILQTVCGMRQCNVILVEGGPQLLGDFLAEGLLDELFLTLAPQIAGRDTSTERPGLVTGQRFAPEHPLWGTLVSVKRAGSHLFLRYAFETKETTP